MDTRVVFLLCLLFTAYVLAKPASDEASDRSKRESVMDSMKSGWAEVGKTFSEAGDTVVNAVKPTEKSTLDKIADEAKKITS